MYNKYLILILIFATQLVVAQDTHFSQPALNISNSNPARVGMMMPAEFMLQGSYRSQWASITAPYRTYNAAFEHQLNSFSWGLDVLSNDAGEASIKQNNLRLKAAYQKTLANNSSLRAGVSLGVIQQRFNPEVFQFDNQYQAGVGFNGDLSNGETFEKNSQVIPDVSAGLIYTNTIGKIKNEIGFSMLHINKALASFYNDGTTIYPTRTFLHINSSLPVNKRWEVNGQVQFTKQATAQSLIFGLGGVYQLNKEKSWNFNIASRKGDAIILSTGLQMKNIAIAISYDAHQSKLAQATNGNGAIELSASYYFNRGTQNERVAIQEETAEPTNDPLKDSDKDGVPDGVDECPYIPGVWKYAGCNDKDDDGVYDTVDACPNLFGAKENNGCPMDKILDSDMDGLIDKVDQCPFLKGLPEHQGCPDSDKDGVSDKIDQCPFLKGESSNNGCPKVSANSTNEISDHYLPSVHVNFDTDQAIIKPMYWPQLDEVVKVLLEKTDLKIYISGHTDAEGDAAYNHTLGESRSFEVMNYFVSRGINLQRITIISYGETKPIHTNKHVYGKAKNRRAEVIVVK